MRLVIFALFFCWSIPLLAQTGNYFLSHYEPSDERSDNVCFAMAQDDHGILYFATKAGVLQFDGRNWSQLSGNGAVYTLNSNSSGEIYWGGANGFGKISYDENEFIQNERLSDVNEKDIFQSIITGDQAYFLSDETLFIFSKNSKKIDVKGSNLTGSFSGLFELHGKVYINTERGGIFVIEQNQLVKTSLKIPSEIVFANQYENTYLVGTSDNRIYLCSRNLIFREIKAEDQAYINASVVVSGSWINKQLIVLGTLRGGVIFINPLTGKTQELVNYNTGLPDNEVFALMSDRNQNIWIAHDYGFTRVAPYLPLHSFNHYEGLQGNLLCALSYQHQVYAGTSLGLFRLEKVEVYDEIISYENIKTVDKKSAATTASKGNATVSPAIEEQSDAQVESKKKGFFNFLKRKKKQDDVADKKVVDKKEPETIKEEETSKLSFFKRKPKQRKVIQKVLRSSQYVYKKVNGIDAKVTQLLEVQGKLLAAGLSGAYEVAGLKSKPILEEPVRFIFANKSILLASTYEDEMRAWSLVDKVWTKTNLLDNLDDEVNYIFEGNANQLWLCALDKVYKIEITGNEIKNIQSLTLPNSNLDKSIGIQYKGKTIVVNAGGFYTYDQNKNEIVKIDTLPKPSVYFAGDKNLWYRDNHGWNLLTSAGRSSNLQLLNLFQDLRFITADQSSSNFWLITGENELFKFYGEKLRPYEAGYPLLIKSIRNGDENIISQKKIKIDERQSALSVEVVLPDYISAQSMEYRYFLKGLHQAWSDWDDNNNMVDFPYLPPGKYTLQIQAKDIFGKISEIESVSILVQPPYWQRLWFYALEFVLFALLVVASFRLSSKYVIISRILSLLTIILLIQFIQTVAGYFFSSTASPVLDFFIQVIVALLILPVEGYLRKHMVRSIDAHEIYSFIRKKKEGTGEIEKTDADEL